MHRESWRRFAWALAAMVCAMPVQAARVEGVRVWSGPESTRVVLDLSAPVQHRLFSLSHPDRLVVDLPSTALAGSVRLPEAKGFVAGVRTGKRPDGVLRVVLDLKRPVTPKSFLLEPNKQYGDRLVIDLNPAGAEKIVKRAPVASRDGGRPLVVAVDAGHGGEDPGASGPDGVREKDVVLAIARQLARDLEAVPGVRAVLTRDGDYFVRYRRRLEIAREHRADLFVSVHADAFRDPSAHGATVYALSTKRASTEAARRLAQRENEADLIGGVSLADKDQLLARVLLDLSQNAAISASITAGDHVIEQLGRITGLRKTKVQQAPFIVLTSPDIPSILVETAYITNPREESFLDDTRHQGEMAQALAAGIVDYFRENAPPDTYLAANPPPKQRGPLRHVITRGETLSEIAARYRVSLTSLRRFNGLHGDVIRIGQVISIPPG